MADNTKQFRWIVVIQQNLEWLFADQETVFVAGDLLWYPVEGDPKRRMAPDVMVVVWQTEGRSWLLSAMARRQTYRPRLSLKFFHQAIG